ncbi:MAG: hypothetical protein WAV40_00490 [Microgenomates group bacterium]
MKVKKEATIAVIIGLIIALIVTGGVLRARHALSQIKMPTKESFTQSGNPSKKDVKPNELFLELATPDNSVANVATFTIAGKTLPGTYIAILGEKGEYLIIPNDIGSFSQEIALIKGANTILITVYQNDGKKVEKTLNAVYTTAQL